jgi:hypothetical protein
VYRNYQKYPLSPNYHWYPYFPMNQMFLNCRRFLRHLPILVIPSHHHDQNCHSFQNYRLFPNCHLCQNYRRYPCFQKYLYYRMTPKYLYYPMTQRYQNYHGYPKNQTYLYFQTYLCYRMTQKYLYYPTSLRCQILRVVP